MVGIRVRVRLQRRPRETVCTKPIVSQIGFMVWIKLTVTVGIRARVRYTGDSGTVCTVEAWGHGRD